MPNSKPVAVLYRMKTPEHICPFGLRSRALLRRKGFDVDDRLLTSREEADAFKAEQDVKTTPQTFIDGQRVGGHEDLRRYLGLPNEIPWEVLRKDLISRSTAFDVQRNSSCLGAILRKQ